MISFLVWLNLVSSSRIDGRAENYDIKFQKYFIYLAILH
ncbi:hypothetical protein MGWOODY_Mmi498 [hydrothermal vent metagenome]|uniref:Uncharacterized protein n=1 Tax=hydrothermal vent metagenome TaxID=652676 RepID=A0A160VHX8_9ZZZZ